MATRLIREGAPLNAADKDKDTPLQLAIILEYQEIAALLEQAEAVQNSTKVEPSTSLNTPAAHKSVECVQSAA